MPTPARIPSKIIELLTEAATDPQKRDDILEGKEMPSGLSQKDIKALTSGDSNQIWKTLGAGGEGQAPIVFVL